MRKLAGEPRGDFAGENACHRARSRLPLRVRRTVGTVLHVLRRGRDIQRRPTRHTDKVAVEGVRGEDWVEQPTAWAPTLGRTLLKQTDRITVAVVQVPKLRLLQCGR